MWLRRGESWGCCRARLKRDGTRAETDSVFQRNGRVNLNRRGSQFSRLLAVEECGSAGRPWIDHVPKYSTRVVATLSNPLLPLHFPSHASPCAITFRTACTSTTRMERLTPLLAREDFIETGRLHLISHCWIKWNSSSA